MRCGHEVGVFQDRHICRRRRCHARNVQFAKCPKHAPDGGVTVGAPHDQLADEVVVELADLVAGLKARVKAHAEAVGCTQRRDATGRRQEGPTGRVLGVDADLDCMAADLHVVLGERQRLAGGDAQLLLNQVKPGHQLGHRVLHLEAGVHLQVPELAVLIQELHGAGVGVVTALCHLHGCLAHGCTHLV